MAKGSRKKLTVIGPHLGAKNMDKGAKMGAKKMTKMKTHGKPFGGK
jgi:hypothetical protein